MVKVPEFFIVRKDGLWLVSGRPDLLQLPNSHTFSQYTYDAKKFNSRYEAKRKARKIGGEVWKFIPALGKTELVTVKPPEGAKCDNCRKWTPFDGICRNPESENYRDPVSMENVCDDWEGKSGG